MASKKEKNIDVKLKGLRVFNIVMGFYTWYRVSLWLWSAMIQPTQYIQIIWHLNSRLFHSIQTRSYGMSCLLGLR